MGDKPPTSGQRTTAGPGRAGLPAERAFVIHLREDADLARGIVRGRVEHVLSGAAALFDSLEQLAELIRDVVAPTVSTALQASDPLPVGDDDDAE